MGNYWCNYCSAFVPDSKLGKQQHEQSQKHKNSLQRSLSRVHKKNVEKDKSEKLAKAEIQRINKELGIADDDKNRPNFQKGFKKTKSSEEKPVVIEPIIGEWTNVSEQKSESPIRSDVLKKETAVETESVGINSIATKQDFNIQERTIQQSLSDEEIDVKPSFNKRKPKKK